jgi:hypothetical protein
MTKRVPTTAEVAGQIEQDMSRWGVGSSWSIGVSSCCSCGCGRRELTAVNSSLKLSVSVMREVSDSVELYRVSAMFVRVMLRKDAELAATNVSQSWVARVH